MKIKKWKCIVLIAYVLVAIVALVKKQEYTNLLKDEENLKLFAVAPINNNILPDSMDIYREQLAQSPIVLKVRAEGKREYSYKTIKQSGTVIEVYKGTNIVKGEKIEVLTTRTTFSFEDMTFNMGFSNLMKKDNEYLIFIDEKIESPYENDNIYRISDLVINPIFNFSDVDNQITESGRYVSYSLVMDNGFAVGDVLALQRILSFKNELLKTYTNLRVQD